MTLADDERDHDQVSASTLQVSPDRGGRRQRRRRALGATVALAVVGGTLGGLALARGGRSHVSQVQLSGGSAPVVPWLDESATVPPSPTPGPPLPAYRACRADQLAVSLGRGGVYALDWETVVVLTNVSSSRCSLSGYPTSLIGVHSDGVQQPLAQAHGTQSDEGYAWPANLLPGQSGGLGIVGNGGCQAAQQNFQEPATEYAGEIIGLPGGGSVRASAPLNAICGVAVTRLGAPAPPAPTGTYPGLSAHADLPSQVVAGTVLAYTVTLTNNTSRPMSLSPCPVYQEIINVGHPAQYTYRLNCTIVHAVPANGSVTYAMEIPVPDTRASRAKFGWFIPNSAGASASTVMTVTTRA